MLNDLDIVNNSDRQEAQYQKHFAFGENWSRFLSVLDEERIKQAEESLKLMLETEDLSGKSFLDIGSGSGLFSLAAKRLGAKVFSFDYDPMSVNCTQELKYRYYKDDMDWTIEQGSVLDIEYLRRLGKFDILYSWGVLHHTGAMWDALRNVDMNVAPNGKLFLGLYNDQGTTSKIWWIVKKMYNSFPKPLRFIILLPILIILWGKAVALNAIRSRNPLASFTNYKKGRGMSPYYDLVDWVGGFPFEVSKPGDIFEFYKKLGYQLTKLSVSTGHGCNQYVFQRQS